MIDIFLFRFYLLDNLVYKVNNKRVRKILPVFLTTLILLVIASSKISGSLADEPMTTGVQSFSIPPTSEGPGLLLPDSPFYFLDEIKQNIRLAFAVTPTQKANVYSSVAGERVAELRFELIKNNVSAAEIAVRGVRENTAYAVKEVADAKLWGADVENLAGDINQKIKMHLQILDGLENQATGELKAEVTVAIASLTESKGNVEAYLSKAEIDSEMKDDLRMSVIRSAQNTLNDADELKNNLTLLQKQQESVSFVITPASKKTTAAKQKQNLPTALQSQSLTDAQDITTKAQAIMDNLDTTFKINTPTPTPRK